MSEFQIERLARNMLALSDHGGISSLAESNVEDSDGLTTRRRGQLALTYSDGARVRRDRPLLFKKFSFFLGGAFVFVCLLSTPD